MRIILASTVAQPKPKRRSRKRHAPRGAPRANAAQHRNPPRSAREALRTGTPRTASPLKTFGDPPPNKFGGVPVAEIAILAGAIGFVVGLVNSAAAVTVVWLPKPLPWNHRDSAPTAHCSIRRPTPRANAQIQVVVDPPWPHATWRIEAGWSRRSRTR